MEAVDTALQLEVVHRNGVVVVVARGEIDLASAPMLARALDHVTDRSIVLDLSQVSYLDAAGIALAVQTKQRLCARGARLVVRDPSPIVRRLLTVTGDDDLIERL